MKKFSKIGALVLAMMMILAMSVPAFADGTGTNAYTGSGNAAATTDIAGTTTIPLNKTIVIFNTTDGTEVREPDVTFTYTVTPVTGINDFSDPTAAKKYVVDEHSKKAIIYDGVAGGVTGTTITFASTAKVAATTKGFEDQHSGNLTVDLSKFSHAGVYRYKIEETQNPTDVTTIGMEARDTLYDNTRYLDLYIYNNATTGAREVGAAIIFKTTITTSGDEGKDPITTATKKTTGFEPATDPGTGTTDYTDDTTVDRYFTYNFQLKKVITGNLADKNNQFPFEIAITGNLAHGIVADVNNNGTTSTINVTNTAVNETAALKNNETYTVTGLPKNVTVDVKETNNTYDIYSLTTKTENGKATDLSAYELAPEAFTNLNGIKVNSGNESKVVATNDTVVTFTNELVEVSPTGVVLRVAPFVGIMGAGLFLLLIAKRSKKDEDEDEDAVLETIPQNN